MIKHLQNLYSNRGQRKQLNNFYKLEDSMNSKIGEIQQNHKDYSESLEKENILKSRLNEIQIQNPELIFEGKGTEKSNEMRRLKALKWFAVFVEALFSYNAINLFLKETIGISFVSGVTQDLEFVEKIILIAKSLIFSIPVAYLFLQSAIRFKYNDLNKYSGKNRVTKYWYNLTWIFPLLVIPFLNLFLVIKHPNHESNSLWIFFSLLTLLINVKLVNYHSQFNELEKYKELEKLVKPINDELKNENVKRNRMKETVQKIFTNLRTPAADFRRSYESFGSTKPILSMNPLYIILMNRYFYNGLVLSMGELTNVNPPTEFNGIFDYLDKTVSPRDNVWSRIEGHNEKANESTSINDDSFMENESESNKSSFNNESSEDDIFI